MTNKLAYLSCFVIAYLVSGAVFLIDWFTGYRKIQANEPSKTMGDLFASLGGNFWGTVKDPLIFGTLLGILFLVAFHKKYGSNTNADKS